MKDLLEQIIEKQHTKANEIFESHMSDIVESKLNEVKKMVAARMDEQVTVDHTGKVHTASGEEILPSVYRARRQLAEGKWSKKVQPGDEPEVVKAKKKKAKRAARLAPEMSDEKYAALVKKAEETKAKREIRAKNTEERRAAEAEQAKKDKMEKAARQIARQAGMSVNHATKVIKGEMEKPSRPAMTDDDYAENIRENPPRAVGEKPKKPGIVKRVLSKLGLKEEALNKAKSILEAREKKSVPPTGTGSDLVLGPKAVTYVVKDPNMPGGKRTVMQTPQKRGMGSRAEEGKIAKEIFATRKRPGTYKE